MKRMIAVLMAVALGGCTVARMADFGTVGESDRIDVTNVPGWANGTFRLGDARGLVRRLAATDAIGWGPDGIGPSFDNVKVGLAAGYGTIAFVLDSKDVGGRLEGRCRYARTEVRDHVAGLDVATPAQPLALRCAYRVDDRPVGQLELEAVTLKTAAAVGFPTDRLIFEFTENEEMVDTGHVANIVETYRRMGFSTAIDDFRAGHAGIALLSRFQTDIVKLDMTLIRDLDTSMPRRMIVEGLVRMFERMDIALIAEGIETLGEYQALRWIGVQYIQGYFLARPGFRCLPAYDLPHTELGQQVCV